MIRIEVLTKDPEETALLGKLIGEAARPGDVVLFTGDLGAGKTTMSQGIAEGLDILEEVTSPTFTLMQIYHGRMDLYHLDVYRLSSEEEALDIGIEEAMYGEGLCLMEWAEHFPSLWPEDHLLIRIERRLQAGRKIEMSAQGAGESFLGRILNKLERKGIDYESA